MPKTAIMTDTNSGISVEEGREMGIFVQPMPVILDGQNYLEGVDVTHADVYAAMKAKKDVSTSQPAAGLLMETWEKIFAEGYDEIVYMPMSSGLSGSCATSSGLALEYDGRVHVADNHRISVTMRTAAEDAAALAAQGMGAAEIKERLEKNAFNSVVYLAVNTLEYLKKSGRVTASAAAIAAVLNIKPVLITTGEKFDTFAKIRGMQNAKAKILEAAASELENRFKGIPHDRIRVATAGTFETEAEEEAWRAEVQAAFPDFSVRYDKLSCSVACHTGIGAAGLGMMLLDR